MNKQYQPLFDPIELPNGVTLQNRFAMASMLVFGSEKDGHVAAEDYAYFEQRNDTGALIITGAAAVSKAGLGMVQQLTIFDDDNIENLKKLADIIKSKGNKAIVQLHNAGREAVGAHELYGEVLAPSAIDFPFLDYVPKDLTHEQILSIIDDYGKATRRAIEAGFDGVEIHGANHYLLQQFFSEYSNTRTDQWGGSLEKRMAFPLAVVDKVKEVVAKHADGDFIVGYRISPEEIHGENVGYTVNEAVQLIDKVVDKNIDYMHLSTFDYAALPETGESTPVTTIVRESINGRVPMVVAGDVLTPEAALDALNYTDIIALGRAVLIDPDFVPKLRDGKADAVETTVENRLENLAFPATLKSFWQIEGTPLPPLKGLNA